MATYNGEKYLREQIDSILSQIGTDDELVISDDGSKDKTIEIIMEYEKDDTRVKLLHNTVRHKVVGNFENALKNCKGEYIFLADQDDVWLENKYSIMIDLLQKYDVVVSDSIVTDSELKTLKSSFFELHKSGTGILKNIKKSTYYGSCMAFNRKILQKSLPFPSTIGHDLWIGIVGEIFGKVYFLHKPLILYRRHENVHCLVLSKSTRPIYKQIWERVIMLYYVMRLLFSKTSLSSPAPSQ
jgi:glycosyltransferase involved in cell wall biosynthesis